MHRVGSNDFECDELCRLCAAADEALNMMYVAARFEGSLLRRIGKYYSCLRIRVSYYTTNAAYILCEL